MKHGTLDQAQLEIALPADVIALLGETDEQQSCRAREAVILHLLREGAVSQGRVAKMLGLTRHDVLDLMAKYDIPSGPQTIEEYRREVEQAARLLSKRT